MNQNWIRKPAQTRDPLTLIQIRPGSILEFERNIPLEYSINFQLTLT